MDFTFSEILFAFGLTLFAGLSTGIGSALFADGVLVTNTELGHLERNGVEARQQDTVERSGCCDEIFAAAGIHNL